MDDERPGRTEYRKHLGDGSGDLGRVHAHDLRACAGGVRQRADEIEDGARAELAPNGGGMSHGRMMHGREHEAESVAVDRRGNALGWNLQPEAERLDHVGGARGRGDRPVAVFCDSRARSGGHDSGGGGDVERPRAVSAGPGRVDEIGTGRVDRQDVIAHRLRAAGDLRDGFSFCPQRNEETTDLGGSRVAAHDLVHHLTCLVARQVSLVEELRDRGLDHAAKSGGSTEVS